MILRNEIKVFFLIKISHYKSYDKNKILIDLNYLWIYCLLWRLYHGDGYVNTINTYFRFSPN